MTPAVVMGLSPTGLHAVRELGRVGVPVTGVAEGLQAGRLSRYLSDCIVHADPLRRLEQLCEWFPARPGGVRPVLIPTSDQDVEFVIAHGQRLQERFAFQRSYLDGSAGRIMTKESFYGLCDTHGVAYPRLWKAAPGELAALRDRVAYPCIVKPSRIHDIKRQMGGRKGWIARNAGEFDALLPTLPAQAGMLLVQEIVAGPENAITLYCGYFDAAGHVHQPFTARKLRQYPPGFGSASLAQSSGEEGSRAIAERLLRAIGYAGVAAAEFKRDPRSGALKMIEINVRPSLWFALCAAAGKHPVLACYLDLAGGQQVPPETAQRAGVRWRYGLKDAWSAGFYRLHPDFVLPAPDTECIGPALTQVSAVYAADDPKPVLGDALNFAARLGHRIAGAARGR